MSVKHLYKYWGVFIFAFIIVSCSTSNFNTIEGRWIAEGYTCEDRKGLIQEIAINQTENSIYAIKLIGDACIQAGDTTWYGEIKSDRIIGKIKGMNPQTREYEWIPCEIHENLGFLYLSVDKFIVLKMKQRH